MTDQRWTLRNIARRPIELHDAAEVTVLAADGTIEVEEIGNHHAALIDRGLMTAHAAPPAAESTRAAAAAPARTARKRKSPTKPSRRKGEGA